MTSFFGSSLWIAFQLKGFVQRTYRELHVLVMNEHRGLDFTGADHLDVDVFIGQRFKHQARNTGV